MKKLFYIVPFVSLVGWAAYESDERLNTEDEATIAACNFVKRNPDPFRDEFKTDSDNEALNRDWLKYPSHELQENIQKKSTSINTFEYKSAFCEVALHRILVDLDVGTEFIGPRCKALVSKHEYFLDDYKSGQNNYLKNRMAVNAIDSAERHWCNGRAKTALMQIACSTRETKRIAMNSDSQEYENALDTLRDTCSAYLPEVKIDGRGGSRTPRRSLAQDDSPAGGQIVARDQGPIIIPRYHYARPGMQGGCGGGGLNAIIMKPSTSHTIMTGLVAGMGAYLSYRGASQVDEYNYKLSSQVIKSYQAVGAVPLFQGGTMAGQQFWGQNGMSPMPGGMPGGGMCGRPPFHTGHTGCQGGMPGSPAMCPGGNCGMQQPGCFPGMPCAGGGGGCRPGMPCSGQMPMCAQGMQCGHPGCPMGSQQMCQQAMHGAYPNNNYLNNPAYAANPNMNNNWQQNPYNLDAERARLQQMQDDLNRRNAEMAKAQQARDELARLQQQMGNLNNKYNSALSGAFNGYPGMMGNSYGPTGAYGNPGAYRGPMQGPMGNCGAGQGVNCACTTVQCYPGQQSAYYAPPYVVGNSGYGGQQYGYPRNQNSFQLGFSWTGVAPKSDDSAVNAR